MPVASLIDQQRELRAFLRTARLAAGQDQRMVADALGWPTAKVIHMEASASEVSLADFRSLMQLYGLAESPEAASFVRVIEDLNKPQWWEEYREDLPPYLSEYVVYETTAARLYDYQNQCVPGVLQTEEYARAIMDAYPSKCPMRRPVELRMARQQALLADEDRRGYFLIHEQALARLFGNAGIMVNQLRHLQELAKRPNIEIQIVTFRSLLGSVVDVPFALFDFNGSQDDVLTGRNQNKTFTTASREVGKYTERFLELREHALSPRDSVVFMADLEKRFGAID